MEIQIDIDDERHFTDVAPVIDREDFAEEVHKLRKRLEPLLRVSLPHKDVDLAKIYSKDNLKIIDVEVDKSRKLLYLPVVFKSVIEAVALRNCVTDADYSPAYLDCKRDESFDKEGNTPDETYSIVLSPGVRDGDVLKALQKYRDQVGNVKGIPNYDYVHQVWEVNQEKPAIKKYRKWYKTFKSGKTFKDIANLETENCPIKVQHDIGKVKPKGCTCYHESTIKKGIEAYESLVWKTPTF